MKLNPSWRPPRSDPLVRTRTGWRFPKLPLVPVSRRLFCFSCEIKKFIWLIMTKFYYKLYVALWHKGVELWQKARLFVKLKPIETSSTQGSRSSLAIASTMRRLDFHTVLRYLPTRAMWDLQYFNGRCVDVRIYVVNTFEGGAFWA